tara:strand:+ start:6851 stop:7132 length:282 start_codon:yes stop_codon:yes gene_type:complete
MGLEPMKSVVRIQGNKLVEWWDLNPQQSRLKSKEIIWLEMGLEPITTKIKIQGNELGERWDSNPRQPESQSRALPTELRPPNLSGPINILYQL